MNSEPCSQTSFITDPTSADSALDVVANLDAKLATISAQISALTGSHGSDARQVYAAATTRDGNLESDAWDAQDKAPVVEERETLSFCDPRERRGKHDWRTLPSHRRVNARRVRL